MSRTAVRNYKLILEFCGQFYCSVYLNLDSIELVFDSITDDIVDLFQCHTLTDLLGARLMRFLTHLPFLPDGNRDHLMAFAGHISVLLDVSVVQVKVLPPRFSGSSEQKLELNDYNFDH